MDCSLPGFFVHGIFQARVLEWVAISFSRGSSWPRNRTQVSCIAGRRFTLWATREAHVTIVYLSKLGNGIAGRRFTLWATREAHVTIVYLSKLGNKLFWILQLFHWSPFPFQGSNPRSHLVFTFEGSVVSSPWVLPCVSWPWYFWWVLINYFVCWLDFIWCLLIF